MMATERRTQRVRLWQDTIDTDVEIVGSGPSVVYLHGPWGLPVDRPFIDRLAERTTVYAPRHPGTTPDAPDAIHAVDSLHDLVVYYAELFDRLELQGVPLIGHSVGGMIACEIAAATREWASRLVLIDPVGLWRDDRPVKNWMIMPDQQRRAALFGDPDGAAAREFFDLPDPERLANFIWAQACTGKFVWPLPERGLQHRMHRIQAPALIMWGARDGIIDTAYADEFAHRLANARVERIDGAGHLPHLERAESVAKLVLQYVLS